MTIGQKFNPYKLLNGIHIPEGIVSATNILPGAKLAYGRLLRYAGEDGDCYPAVRTLAKEIGVKERQCQNYLSELEGLGLIRRIKRFSERGDRTSNAFEFLWHPLLGAVQEITPAPVQPSPPPVQSDAPTPMHASAHKESHVLRESRFNKNNPRSDFDDWMNKPPQEEIAAQAPPPGPSRKRRDIELTVDELKAKYGDAWREKLKEAERENEENLRRRYA